MKSKKRVLLTVNPGLIEGKRFQTVRSMVTGLHSICDLFVMPISEYDFKRKRVNAYRRIANGQFVHHGWIKPEADIWIVYTDGYWLNSRDMGFKRDRDFLEAQLDLHEGQFESGRVGKLINTVQAERHCLKSWFCQLDAKKWGVVPTYSFSKWNDVHDFLKREKTIVAKPDWGGGGTGVHKIANEKQLEAFRELMLEGEYSLKEDYCFQPLVSGPEIRFWYVNGTCVGARKVFGRNTPWSDHTDEFRIIEYWQPSSKQFQDELAMADRLCRKSGITLGSVDFIGPYINEINGAGTTYTQYDVMTKITDVRKPLVDYLASTVRE